MQPLHSQARSIVTLVEGKNGKGEDIYLYQAYLLKSGGNDWLVGLQNDYILV